MLKEQISSWQLYTLEDYDQSLSQSSFLGQIMDETSLKRNNEAHGKSIKQDTRYERPQDSDNRAQDRVEKAQVVSITPTHKSIRQKTGQNRFTHTHTHIHTHTHTKA